MYQLVAALPGRNTVPFLIKLEKTLPAHLPNYFITELDDTKVPRPYPFYLYFLYILSARTFQWITEETLFAWGSVDKWAYLFVTLLRKEVSQR